MLEVTNETKVLLAEQEQAMWLRTVEQILIKIRVQKRLKNDNEVKMLTEEMEKCENALDEISKIIQELKQE